ncbi:hypothetical protein EVJ29_06870 [Exiguobacterium sp. SH4S7]|uniref:oligosaccharide flippase family protein n=1 Tax=Exiguobacterium sp. SH4S7 TaxID=2510958 RepID=UPI00103E0EA5|nr:oligosaccharide flippase family protein [Exiguobacterium sp. SH4S7]TCI36214.1 hypothetical protein EVJ29_06870 [Exiguobacterium sp. SH4S7]
MYTQIINAFKSTFLKNVLILSTGTAGAQLINFLFSPVLTRIYGPDSFGVLGLYTSLITIGLPLISLSLYLAIPLPKEKNEVLKLTFSSLKIVIIGSIGIFFVLILSKEYIISTFEIENLNSLFLLVPLGILLSGILLIFQTLNIKLGKFKDNSYAILIGTIISNASKLGVGLYFSNALILIILTMLGFIVQIVILLKNGIYVILKEFQTGNIFTGYSVKQSLKKYSDFPLYRSPEMFLNAAAHSVPVIVLTSLFSPSAAGYYSLAIMVLSQPTQLVSESIGNVLYPAMAEKFNNNSKITPQILKVTGLLCLIGVIPFGIIILFGPPIFTIVFGGKWSEAGEYAQWISFWSFFLFINRPSTKALMVMSKQSFQLKFTMIVSLIRIISIVVTALLTNSALIAVATFSVIGVISNIFLIIKTYDYSIKSDLVNVNNG